MRRTGPEKKDGLFSSAIGQVSWCTFVLPRSTWQPPSLVWRAPLPFLYRIFTFLWIYSHFEWLFPLRKCLRTWNLSLVHDQWSWVVVLAFQEPVLSCPLHCCTLLEAAPVCVRTRYTIIVHLVLNSNSMSLFIMSMAYLPTFQIQNICHLHYDRHKIPIILWMNYSIFKHSFHESRQPIKNGSQRWPGPHTPIMHQWKYSYVPTFILVKFNRSW